MHGLGRLHNRGAGTVRNRGAGSIHSPNGDVKHNLFKNGNVSRKVGTINFNTPMLPSTHKSGKSYTYLFAHPEKGMPSGSVMKRMGRKMGHTF